MADQATIELTRRIGSVGVERVTASRLARRRLAAAGPQLAETALRRQLDQRREQLERQSQAERAKLKQACQAARSAAEQLRRFQQGLLAEAEEQLVCLAVEIARKVLMQEIQAGRHEIDPIVAEALKHAPTRGEVVVHLNPEDYARCDSAGAPGGEPDALRFVADPNVPRAECVLETAEGTIESSVEQNLANVAEALRQPE